MIMNDVMPAIREKFPSEWKNENIVIQQDNARPHLKVDDKAITAAGRREGWNIFLECQPPNSPDLNVLDLGFFTSIQSLQHKMSPASVDELIGCVKEAYWQQPVETVQNIFLSLQKCMEATMLDKGGNRYKIPHIGKGKMRKIAGELPTVIECSEEAVLTAAEFC